MTEYKDGDKVVVRLVGADEMQELTGIKVGSIMGCPILGTLEDFQPKEEKIKMTVEEKKEFDELKKLNETLYYALYYMNADWSPTAYNRLYNNNTDSDNNKAQLEFARAWEHPELIEVVHEDVKTVKVAGLYLWKYKNEYKLVADFDMRNENYYFTKRELKKINELEQFKHVDLVGAWEDGE